MDWWSFIAGGGVASIGLGIAYVLTAWRPYAERRARERQEAAAWQRAYARASLRFRGEWYRDGEGEAAMALVKYGVEKRFLEILDEEVEKEGLRGPIREIAAIQAAKGVVPPKMPPE